MGGGRTHAPKYDPQKCLTCGVCTWRCPASVFLELADEKGSLRGTVFSKRPYEGRKAEMPPCRLACPLGQDVPGYVSAVARGDLEEAARIIRATNPLPSACGRLCIASCMRACTRAAIDEGIDIRGIKRVVADTVPAKVSARKKKAGIKVAVIGAGPAGLSAAHRLAELGASVTIFEAEKTAGGMLADTVPSFAMPEKALAADVAAIKASGVSFRTGVRVGKDVSIASLEKDHAAILVATGARRGVVPALPGRELKGVVDAVSFCRNARSDSKTRISGDVVVLGGGRTALLAARLALELGASTASVVHSAPRDAWPAGPDALKAAEKDGVSILAEKRAVTFAGKNGSVSALTVQPLKAGAKDRVGRAALTADGAKQSLPANMIVAATDRRPDDGLEIEGASRGVIGSFTVDGSYRLGRPRWYAAGEAATGAATLVDSMATGRRAAESLIADLNAKPGGSR